MEYAEFTDLRSESMAFTMDSHIASRETYSLCSAKI